MSDEAAVRGVPAGQGWDWIRRGFGLFRQAPWIWIAIVLLLFVLQALANLVPLGGLLVSLLGPVLGAGILFGCRDLQAGEELRLAHLFSGFRSERAGALILLGVLVMLLLLFVAVAISLLMAAMLGGVNLDAGELAANAGIGMLLISLLVLVPALMAIWFTTQLVALHEMDPVPAMKASFAGCLRNLGPLTLYGLMMIPLMLVAMIPLGLGLLILVPTLLAANYFSYLDIYAGASTDRPQAEAGLID